MADIDTSEMLLLISQMLSNSGYLSWIFPLLCPVAYTQNSASLCVEGKDQPNVESWGGPHAGIILLGKDVTVTVLGL